MAEKERPVAKVSGYPVQSILKSEKFRNRQDALKGLLDAEKEYSIKEVEKILSDFMKRKVEK